MYLRKIKTTIRHLIQKIVKKLTRIKKITER